MATEGQSDTMVSDTEMWMKQRSGIEFLHTEKKWHHWCSLMLAEHFWRPTSGCEHSEVVGGAFQQWWQWVIFTDVDCYEHSMQALVYWWWQHTAHGGDCWRTVFCCWEFALSISVIVLFVSVVVSMEINGRHYFQNDLCTIATTLNCKLKEEARQWKLQQTRSGRCVRWRGHYRRVSFSKQGRPSENRDWNSD